MKDSLNQAPEIQKLIALKQFECPPPGHRELSAARIISRLEAEQMRSQQPWYRRCLQALDINPMLITAYSGMVVALLFVGWQYGEHFDAGDSIRSVGNAGLWVVSSDAQQDVRGEMEFDKLDRAPFGMGASLSEGYSSVQPVVHVPNSPVGWLRHSIPNPTAASLQEQP